jgi:thiol-disulfide isomerase/thioredoxin
MMLADRLLVLAVIAAWLILGWLILRLRSQRFHRNDAADLLTIHHQRPLILAFSTPDCVPCRTIQKPAIEQLVRRFPDRVAVRDVDATVEPALAERFGILTVPSTVVIGEGGSVLAINHGLAGWEKLAAQLRLNGAHNEPVTEATR